MRFFLERDTPSVFICQVTFNEAGQTVEKFGELHFISLQYVICYGYIKKNTSRYSSINCIFYFGLTQLCFFASRLCVMYENICFKKSWFILNINFVQFKVTFLRFFKFSKHFLNFFSIEEEKIRKIIVNVYLFCTISSVLFFAINFSSTQPYPNDFFNQHTLV